MSSCIPGKVTWLCEFIEILLLCFSRKYVMHEIVCPYALACSERVCVVPLAWDPPAQLINRSEWINERCLGPFKLSYAFNWQQQPGSLATSGPPSPPSPPSCMFNGLVGSRSDRRVERPQVRTVSWACCRFQGQEHAVSQNFILVQQGGNFNVQDTIFICSLRLCRHFVPFLFQCEQTDGFQSNLEQNLRQKIKMIVCVCSRLFRS